MYCTFFFLFMFVFCNVILDNYPIEGTDVYVFLFSQNHIVACRRPSHT